MTKETGYVICTADGKCFHKTLWVDSQLRGYWKAACGRINAVEYAVYVVRPGTTWAIGRSPCKRCYPNGEVGQLG